MLKKNRIRGIEGCKLAYKEKQFCSHIPDNIKRRLYNMEEFKKYDGGKPRISLIPTDYLDGLMKVLEFGACKYEVDNWKKCKDPIRFYDAAFRHMEAVRGGEELDPESGIAHMYHVACDIMMYQWLTENKEKSDDRFARVSKVPEKEADKEGVFNAGIWKEFIGNKSSDSD